MKKEHFIVPALAAIAISLLSGCAGNPQQHTYWLKNSTTGTYSAHRTYSPLTNDEINELGLVRELPANAKTVD
ncbi:MAG: hypothetical protein IJW39_02450 [Opitutales bacterium]|nr:hypothetical protein [Opitutales bacterium]